MLLSDFDYILPKERIAQEGLAKRDEARLMALMPDNGIEHHTVKDLPGFFRKGDLLILNDTRVSPAKLLGRKDSGGKVDCLVVSGEGNVREALLRGSRIHVGGKLYFKPKNGGTGTLGATVLEKLEGARYKVEFDDPSLIEACGELPLPPYIKKTLEEPERYQTIYSREKGSLAAPTAGLHFTPELLEKLKSQGVEIVQVTLHIGIGTFAPIRTEVLDDWKMHPEYYKISPESAEKINRALMDKRRCFAVGTTSVRTLETATKDGQVKPGEGWTDIFIRPGYKFNFPYSGMLTNFHLPKSSLILLVSALAGKDRIFEAYREAVEKEYRFYSLGDSMLILL